MEGCAGGERPSSAEGTAARAAARPESTAPARLEDGRCRRPAWGRLGGGVLRRLGTAGSGRVPHRPGSGERPLREAAGCRASRIADASGGRRGSGGPCCARGAGRGGGPGGCGCWLGQGMRAPGGGAGRWYFACSSRPLFVNERLALFSAVDFRLSAARVPGLPGGSELGVSSRSVCEVCAVLSCPVCWKRLLSPRLASLRAL